MAWLSLLAAAVLLLVGVVLAPRAVVSVVATLRAGWRSILGALTGFGIGIAPFLLTYVPAVDKLGARRYRDVLAFAPSWRDVFNVGTGNLVWGSLLRHLRPGRPLGYEVSYAVTPILLLLVVAGALGTARSGRARRSGLVLAAAALILVILPIETSRGSPWVVVWRIPGATAIRAADRIQIVGNLVVALALVAVVSEAARRWRSRRPSLLALALGAALLLIVLAEQLNTAQVSNVHRDAEVSVLRSVGPAPTTCTSFFVTDTVHSGRPFYAYQLDAMLISQRVGLPTLNGYTGDTPAGWSLSFPERSSYSFFVKAWADQHGLDSGLCQLELSTMTWVVHPRL
jgi:hypothetical protein